MLVICLPINLRFGMMFNWVVFPEALAWKHDACYLGIAKHYLRKPTIYIGSLQGLTMFLQLFVTWYSRLASCKLD